MASRLIPLLFLLVPFIALGQSNDELPTHGKFTMSALMGPYLLLDDVRYKSVVMKGTRFGYQQGKFHYAIEYIIGNQRDVDLVMGTTHNATGNISYFLLNKEARLMPYLNLGGGFFEFKDFKRDQYGVSFHTTGGMELNMHTKLNGFIECRYLNIGQLDLGGTHQIGVFWGLKAEF